MLDEVGRTSSYVVRSVEIAAPDRIQRVEGEPATAEDPHRAPGQDPRRSMPAVAMADRPAAAVVVTDADHESNIGPWRRLAEAGIEVRTWPLDRSTLTLRLADLEPLIDGRTHLLAFTHCSNILGTLHPVADIARFARERGIRTVVDGVAFAPHRAVDVEALAERLLAWLRDRPGVRIWGSPESSAAVRVATVSFSVEGHDPAAITRVTDRHRVGIRFGHFYSKRLIDRLGLGGANGVVRASFAHYNTPEEADRLIAALEEVLG
jgi:selenocysteine lyase/cysteine desulfurase